MLVTVRVPVWVMAAVILVMIVAIAGAAVLSGHWTLAPQAVSPLAIPAIGAGLVAIHHYRSQRTDATE